MIKQSIYQLKKKKEEFISTFSELEVMNLLGQYIKHCIYSFVYSTIALYYINNSGEKNVCSFDGTLFARFVQIGSVILGIIYISALMRKSTLVNKDYMVMYLINIGFFLVILLFVLYSIFIQQRECSTLMVFQKALLLMCMKKEFELAILIFTRSAMWLRQVNICSNSVFVIIFYSSQSQFACNPLALSLNDFLNALNVSGYLTYTFMNVLVSDRDIKLVSNVLKTTCILIIPIFIYAYFMSFRFQLQGDIPFSSECVPSVYSLGTYVYTIPIDILGMILLQMAISKQSNAFNNFVKVPDGDSLLNKRNIDYEGRKQTDLLSDDESDESEGEEGRNLGFPYNSYVKS